MFLDISKYKDYNCKELNDWKNNAMETMAPEQKQTKKRNEQTQ